MRPVDPNKVKLALELLGLERSWMQLRSLPARSAEEANTHLSAWKSGALKPAYRELAKVHHPDHGGSEERMKELSEAFNLLNTLTIFSRPRGVRGGPVGPVEPPIRRRVVIIHMNIRGGAATYTTNTSSTTSAGYTTVSFEDGE